MREEEKGAYNNKRRKYDHDGRWHRQLDLVTSPADSPHQVITLPWHAVSFYRKYFEFETTALAWTDVLISTEHQATTANICRQRKRRYKLYSHCGTRTPNRAEEFGSPAKRHSLNLFIETLREEYYPRLEMTSLFSTQHSIVAVPATFGQELL